MSAWNCIDATCRIWQGLWSMEMRPAGICRRRTTDYQIIQETLGRIGQGRVQFLNGLSNPPVRDRINAVNGNLNAASGDVRILISPRCRELIRDLEQVVYKEGTGQIDKTTDAMRTHLSDALGYLVWQELRERPAIGEKTHRLFISYEYKHRHKEGAPELHCSETAIPAFPGSVCGG